MSQHSLVLPSDPDAMAHPPRIPGRFPKAILGLSCIACLLLVTGCGSVTVFQSSFNSDAVGSAPAHNQLVGTIDVSGAAGSVAIASPMPNTTGNWAKIQRNNDPQAPISAMQCNLSQLQQGGTYSLVSVLFIPSNNNDNKVVATLEFDGAGQPSHPFLHLDFGDFPQNNTVLKNTVRINDSGPFFGTFPRDQFFSVSVSLEITSTAATAHVTLFGTGASGTQDINNLAPLSFAENFGTVQFYMGYPWYGSFDTQNIIVTRKK